MLYKFKSRATADLIMLEPQGRQIVTIIGKTPGASGIVTAAQISRRHCRAGGGRDRRRSPARSAGKR
ncbi:hypothetical protein QF021_003387 [Acidovorax delafieldii]|nr:hypothetical protein [Acidovorax delafieldii]